MEQEQLLAERDKLLAHVKKQTGVKLDADDPLLAVTVLHEKMLEVILVRIEEAAQRAAAQIAAAVARGITEAQAAASQDITESVAWATEQLQKTRVEISATLIHEISTEVSKAEAARTGAVRASWVAGFAAAVAAAGVGGWALASYAAF